MTFYIKFHKITSTEMRLKQALYAILKTVNGHSSSYLLLDRLYYGLKSQFFISDSAGTSIHVCFMVPRPLMLY